jgi:UDPglucose 6-dehydrogenase
VLGVTFKPNTDDMRDAPAMTIVLALIGGGSKMGVADPQVLREGKALLPGLSWMGDAYEAAKRGEAVVILIDRNVSRGRDPTRLAKNRERPRMAGLRNIDFSLDATWAGFDAYVSVGR